MPCPAWAMDVQAQRRDLLSPREGQFMTRNNMLYLVIGILACAGVVFGYQVYKDQTQPEGLQINAGPDGISIQGK